MIKGIYIPKFMLEHRLPFIIAVQVVLIPISYFLSFALRFDFLIPPHQIDNFIKTIPLLIFFRLFFFYYFDLFSGWWRFVSTEDIVKIIKSVLFSSLCFIASVVFLFNLSMPRSVLILDPILIVLLLFAIRLGTRLFREGLEFKKDSKIYKNVLIMGAGKAGITALNEIRSCSDLHLNPIGFLDDNSSKQGFKIKGVKVLGTADDISKLVPFYEIDEILIAMPSASYNMLQKIYGMCEKANVKFKTLPRIADILSGKTFFSQMRDVHPDELLGRPSIAFRRDSDKIGLQKELANKCILITGAGGSIGSELCRQVASFNPKTLILYERNENNLYFIDLEVRKRFPQISIISIIGDILNKEKLNSLLKMYAPDIVYHAAAYKHVPLMEKDPIEAIRNNVFGSKILTDLCVEYGTQKLVFISTDKAVNPSSIMGTTKRMTEKLLQTYVKKPTKLISVRFGNVIGSSGSVIPLFKKQIAEGGPITITHPEATRFLMTIPEAVQLVLLAGSMGNGGEIFLLDMGKPVNIVELAENLIKLSGLTPYKDIDIEFIGLRDGEKLHEELYWEGKNILSTTNKKIRTLSNVHFDLPTYKLQIEKLEKALLNSHINEEQLCDFLKEMVPESTISPLPRDHQQLM